MVFVSVLTPAFETSGNLQEIMKVCNEKLGLNAVKLYKLVEIDEIEQNTEIIVKLDSGFSLSSIESLLQDHQQIQTQLERAKESLKDYSYEFQKMKEISKLSKPQKVKKLEIENKKLKENFK